MTSSSNDHVWQHKRQKTIWWMFQDLGGRIIVILNLFWYVDIFSMWKIGMLHSLFESMFEFASSISVKDTTHVSWYSFFKIFHELSPLWFKPLAIFSLFPFSSHPLVTSFEKMDSPGLNRLNKSCQKNSFFQFGFYQEWINFERLKSKEFWPDIFVAFLFL